MTNCAQMGIQPSEAKDLSHWEYQGRLAVWNEAHKSPDEIEAPDAERTQKLLDKFNMDPRMFTGTTKG